MGSAGLHSSPDSQTFSFLPLTSREITQMAEVVFGTSNSNFTCFRSLRYFDQKKNVLVMFHDKISHQKSDTKDNRKRRVKNKWILACRNVKIEQQEEEEERPAPPVPDKWICSKKSNNFKQLLRGTSYGNINVRGSNSSAIDRHKHRVNSTSKLTKTNREKSFSLENLLGNQV